MVDNRLMIKIDYLIMIVIKTSLLMGLVCLFFNPLAAAQGSIFGEVTNSDMTTPENGEIYFFGFINDTDNEVRIENSVGAGYDNAFWYDDFQNYLDESPAIPYRYIFQNIVNNEGFLLSKTIPNNSFQQENINLEAVTWPQKPTGLTGICYPEESIIILKWNKLQGLTYHIYRRLASIAGAFYRIDDSTGALSNPGVNDSIYIDSTASCEFIYQYILIAENESGTYSMHSDTVSITDIAPEYLCGDANSDDFTNVGDAVFLINLIFRGGEEPNPIESGDTNCDGLTNVGDAVYLINNIFRGGPDPCADCLLY